MIRTFLHLFTILIASTIAAQDAGFEHKSVTLGYKGNGITIGNSANTNGIRLNFRDRYVERVNGVNVTLWQPRGKENPNSKVNGLAVGLVQSYADELNGVSIGTSFGGGRANGLHVGALGGGAERGFNGIGIGGLGIGSGGNLNGLMLGGLGAGCGGRINGFVFGGLGAGSGDGINGVAIGGLGVGSGGSLNGLMIGGIGAGSGENITGVAIGLVGAGCGNDAAGLMVGGIGVGAGNSITGLSLSLGMVKTPLYTGVAAASYMNVDHFRGLSIALFNRAKSLKGVQLGVINYAGNNPRFLRVLPIVNMHL